MSVENTIVLKSRGYHEEYPAVGAILPGQMLELTAAGKVQPVSGLNSITPKMIAKEDALQGRTITTAYAANEIVSVQTLMPGDIVQVLGLAAEDMDIADKVVANAAGKGIIAAGTEKQLLGVVLENAGVLAADALVKIRVA